MTLSNGESSPFFSTFRTNGKQTGPVELKVGAKRVKKVAIRASHDATMGIAFYETAKKQISTWTGYTCEMRMQEVPEGQELIGIYGR